MRNLENLKKQAKLILRWHRQRHYPVAPQIRGLMPRFQNMSDSEILAASFKLADAQEMVAKQHGFDSWQTLKTGFSTTPRKLNAMHKPETHEFLKGLHPIPRIGEIKEIVDAVLFLTDATFTTGEILHVDGGAHAGKW